MATGPFQSKLEPFYDYIAKWRAAKPPLTYVRIAARLKEEHQVNVRPETIFRFVKVRSKRSVYRLALRDERTAHLAGKQKTTGKVSASVQERLEKFRQKSDPAEEAHQPFLPPDGRLTYKEKAKI